MRFPVYFGISSALFMAAVAISMITYANYFTALVGLSDTALGVGIVTNFALCLTFLWTKSVIFLFLTRLTANETQSIYQRGWIIVCNSLLYWGTVPGDLYMNPFNLGVCLLSIFVIFILHWVCRIRVNSMQAVADTQLTALRLFNLARLGCLCGLILASDILLSYTAIQSVQQHDYALLLFGLFIVDQLEMSISFCAEFAVNFSSLIYLHRNPEEDDWEPAKPLSAAFRLVSSGVAVIGHCLFVLTFGLRASDFGSVVARGIRLSNHVRRAVKIYTAKSEILKFTQLAEPQDLERENTCVICREEMTLDTAPTSKVAPRKLHCGHTMHAKCLSAWLGQSATCPTCRQNARFVAKPEAEVAAEVRDGAEANAAEEPAAAGPAPRQNPADDGPRRASNPLLLGTLGLHAERHDAAQEVPVVMQGGSSGILGGMFEFELQ